MYTYLQTIRHLNQRTQMPDRPPSLEVMQQAFERMKIKWDCDPKTTIVVAGTNGKGSVCRVLEGVLLAQGKKVGLYTSPHLIETTERIRIGGKPLSKEAFVSLYWELEALLGEFNLSHFEILTAMAVAEFFQNQCLDYRIFEVGLGGTWDATNAIPHSTCVITKIGWDHEHILGPTLPDIARNKLGIVTDESMVIHLPFETPLLSLKEEVNQKYSKVQWFSPDSWRYLPPEDSLKPGTLSYGKNLIPLGMLGQRAAENAALALKTLEMIGEWSGESLDLSEIEWTGRMSSFSWPAIKARCFVSGDHNPQGIASLVDILKGASYESLHLVVGLHEKRDPDALLTPLLRLPRSFLWLTSAKFMGKKLDEFGTWRGRALGESQNPGALLDKMSRSLSLEDVVVVTGSLYLVGDVLTLVNHQVSGDSTD